MSCGLPTPLRLRNRDWKRSAWLKHSASVARAKPRPICNGCSRWQQTAKLTNCRLELSRHLRSQNLCEHWAHVTGMPIRELVEILNDPSRFNRCLRLEMNEKDQVSQAPWALRTNKSKKLTILPNVTGIELVCCKDFLFTSCLLLARETSVTGILVRADQFYRGNFSPEDQNYQ